MFKQFSDYVKNKIAYNKALKHPIYSKAMVASQVAIKNLGLQKYTLKGSPAIIARANELHNFIISVIESANPVLTFRNIFCQNTLALGKMIILLPKDKKTEMKNQPGITGELCKHLVKIAKLDKSIREDLYSTPNTPEVMNDSFLNTWISGKYILNMWFYLTLNALREAIGDHNPNKKNDWRLPSLHASCVFDEYCLRKTIGLKTNVGSMAAIAFSTFNLNFVLNGEKYPDLAFREAYADQIKDKSIALPKF